MISIVPENTNTTCRVWFPILDLFYNTFSTIALISPLPVWTLDNTITRLKRRIIDYELPVLSIRYMNVHYHKHHKQDKILYEEDNYVRESNNDKPACTISKTSRIRWLKRSLMLLCRTQNTIWKVNWKQNRWIIFKSEFLRINNSSYGDGENTRRESSYNWIMHVFYTQKDAISYFVSFRCWRIPELARSIKFFAVS